MKYVVVGVERSAGCFKDNGRDVEYDNIYLHCFAIDTSAVPKKVALVGNLTEIIKMNNDFSIVMKAGNPVDCFEDLLGCQVYPMYNKTNKDKIDRLLVESIDGTV